MPDQIGPNFEAAVEADIQRLSVEVKANRERPELKGVGGQEIVKKSIQTMTQVPQVGGQTQIGRDPMQQALPDVPVGVDQAGQDDAARRLHDLNTPSRQPRPDVHDPVIPDQDIRLRQVTDRRIHRRDVATPDQYIGHAQMLIDRSDYCQGADSFIRAGGTA